MKNIFKRNQIVITALAIMIAAAFYLNYAGRIDAVSEVSSKGVETSDGDLATDISDEDAQATDANATQVLDMLTQATDGDDDIPSNDVDLTNQTASVATDSSTVDTASAAVESATTADSSQVTTETTDGTSTPGEAVLTSSTTSVGIIAEAKLNREQIRAKSKETLLEIINNENIADDQKQAAITEMIAMTDISEKEAAAELLLESKGYTDSVVSITGDSADVVINISNVTDAALAQIEDVVTRKTGVAPENITITPVTTQN